MGSVPVLYKMVITNGIPNMSKLKTIITYNQPDAVDKVKLTEYQSFKGSSTNVSALNILALTLR